MLFKLSILWITLIRQSSYKSWNINRNSLTDHYFFFGSFTISPHILAYRTIFYQILTIIWLALLISVLSLILSLVMNMTYQYIGLNPNFIHIKHVYILIGELLIFLNRLGFSLFQCNNWVFLLAFSFYPSLILLSQSFTDPILFSGVTF
jgi:hypothetical protein